MAEDKNAPATFDEAYAMAMGQGQLDEGGIGQTAEQPSGIQDGVIGDPQPVNPDEPAPVSPPEPQEAQATQEPQGAAAPAAGATEGQQQAQPDPQLMAVFAQMQQQMQQLAAENQQLKQLQQEISGQNEAAAIEDALAPPELDIGAMAYDDDETAKSKQAAYAQAMQDYVRQKVMGELSPLMDMAKQAQQEQARQDALNGLSKVPEFAGIMGMAPVLESIIQRNPALQSSGASMEDTYSTAYVIAKGIEAMRAGQQPAPQPQQPTVDDIAAMYADNPALQKRIKQIEARRVAASAASAPPMGASAGAFTAPLAPPPQKPKDFDEARIAAMRQMGFAV